MDSMNKNLVSILLIAASLAMFWFFLKPKYSEVMTLQDKRKEYQKYLEDAEEVRHLRGKLLAAKANISKEDWAKLDRILPDKLEDHQLLLDLNGIASLYGAELTAFSTEAGKESSPPAPNINTEALEGDAPVDAPVPEQVSAHKTLLVNVSFDGSFRNFLGLLQEIERSINLSDVTSLSINTGNASKGSYGITLVINNYWLKKTQ
jgi:hypothetical protein